MATALAGRFLFTVPPGKTRRLGLDFSDLGGSSKITLSHVDFLLSLGLKFYILFKKKIIVNLILLYLFILVKPTCCKKKYESRNELTMVH